jgi:tetratricopeptide (TPR) repeat protein
MMNDVLDLSVELRPPPESSSPEILASVELRCNRLGLSPHRDDLLADPLTSKERARLTWYLEEYWRWPFEGFAERAASIERELLPDVGKRLYGVLFGSAGAGKIVQPWRLQPGAWRRQISFWSTLPRALSLPWELLHDEQGFLALRTQPVSILRRLPQGEAASLLAPFSPPLRVLLVTARPEDEGFVDPRTIARELLDGILPQIERGAVVLEFLRPPTLPALRRRLRDTEHPVHVLHFDGHGAFRGQLDGGRLSVRNSAQGVLAFETEEGKARSVQADELANVLQGAGVRLAMLTACQSALGSADAVFSSVAAHLIRGGVDAVGAMSSSVLVTSAARYTEAFYSALAAGEPAFVAQEHARQALHDDPRRHLFRRHLDEEAEFVELRDWWLPHFFQQRPLELHATAAPIAIERKPPRFTNFPLAPRYGFVGRSRELLQIERLLLKKKLVVLFGFGGMGKTAVAREVADWLSNTGMYGGACFVSFEGGGGAAKLLSMLGTHLEISSAEYDSSHYDTALSALRVVLEHTPTLVIVDNLESILTKGEAELEVPERAKLWDVMLKLAGMLGCGVLATTRDTNFDDVRMGASRVVTHLPLEGLHPEDAYALASNLLSDLGIDRAYAPYPEMRNLLEKLDHHPLAIQLVLPMLREESLSRIHEGLATLLPRFEDDTETGRNKSLLASLEYSLGRLSEEQRSLLLRLAYFEGGASEAVLLHVTQIPVDEWATLRSALEQAALLRAETLNDFGGPFLRFHPVLVPYLRGQLGTKNPALEERYAKSYHAWAEGLKRRDRRDPQAARLVVLRELPNLRLALDLILAKGDLYAASVMVANVGPFLDNFGLWRERNEISRKLAEAVASADADQGEALTETQYRSEMQLGDSAFETGEIEVAYEHFKTLLSRIEASPEEAVWGRGSFMHSALLLRLAECLSASGKSAAGEGRARQALEVIEGLTVLEPEEPSLARARGAALKILGDLSRNQGKYPQGREAYEESLKIARQLDDPAEQAVISFQIGSLALKQQDYTTARQRFTTALTFYHELGQPSSEAGAWYNLGHVAQGQRDFAEAERSYRNALAIWERFGHSAHAVGACVQLGATAVEVGDYKEAEKWCRRGLGYPGLQASGEATIHAGLAYVLLEQVRQGLASETRLDEAQRNAERALELMETLDASLEKWKILANLADIADLRGHAETARHFRKREREDYAAFEGNQHSVVDPRWDAIIKTIAVGAQSNEQAKAEVEDMLPRIEDQGWHITDATRRIWAGERDWHTLAEGLTRAEALVLLRVLKTIEEE